MAREEIVMDSGGLGFRGTVLAGLVVAVLAPAILAGASWLFGFHHQAWLAVVTTAHVVGDALAYSVPVPVALLVIFAGFVFYVWRGAVLRKRGARAKQTAVASRTTAAVAEPTPLSDNEIKVVRLLA